MWHKMLDGWQCCEGFGFRTAFRENGDPFEVIGFRPDGTFSIGAGGRREVPASVMAWLAAPFGSERPLPLEADGQIAEVAGYLKDGTPVFYGREP